MKALTREQVASRKEKAARFVRGVLGDSDRADEIEDESLQDYAERRKFKIVGNPRGAETMPTKEELQRRITELEEENDELLDQLDQVADIVAPVEDDEDNGEDGTGEEEDEPGED